MFFNLSKIFWFIFEPTNLIFLGLILAVALLWMQRTRAAKILLSLIAVTLMAVAIFPAGYVVTRALEDRFPLPARMPQDIAGIIILGGVVNPFLSAARGVTSVGGAAERIIEGAALARRYPTAPVVFSGGSGRLTDQSRREADYVLPLFEALGVPKSRIVLEENARNTHENAINIRPLVAETSTRPWILVTSAFHMPRAVGTFREAGWRVLAYPVDYGTMPVGPDGFMPWTFDVRGNLSGLSHALHEVVGLVAYRLTGRSDSAYPGP